MAVEAAQQLIQAAMPVGAVLDGLIMCTVPDMYGVLYRPAEAIYGSTPGSCASALWTPTDGLQSLGSFPCAADAQQACASLLQTLQQVMGQAAGQQQQ